ncbi:hypothetical protein [Sinorhizobium fredii]|uniref:hypothetical protein n=1 Tax=Rhizobium fredii TaxID=380 RepID=UPI00059DCBFD|nr:hypothetical protein [Sinorhizobium fredii]
MMRKQKPNPQSGRRDAGKEGITREKFSQAARQPHSIGKAKKKISDQWIDGDALGDDVTLISKGKVSCRSDEKTLSNALFRDEIANLTKMELRRRYPAEANSHRNMLSRREKSGAVIHPKFRDFVSFLSLVGPIPAKGATLDRINNSDPEYGPGKVRWADKRTQNNNKSDTVVFHYSRTGDTYTVSRLARLQGVTPSAIRKRLERGWSDDEIIEGKSITPAERPLAAEPVVQRPATTPTSRLLSAKEIAHQRMADSYEYHRREYGEEALPASLEFLREELPEYHISAEGYERHFKQLWPRHRPHVNFEKVPESQKILIAKIDPDYVAEWQRKAAQRDLLKDLL